jgi:hypothetical protein
MDPRQARRIAATAIGLGIAGDLLFDHVAGGVNVPIAVVVVLVASTIVRPAGAVVDRLDLWQPPVAVLASIGVALRTDPTIVALDVALAAAAALAWTIAVSGEPLTRRSVVAVAALGAWAVGWLGLGSAIVAERAVADGSLRAVAASSRGAAPVIRGLVLAVPIVVVFAVLLSSADAIFRMLVDDILAIPIDFQGLLGRTAFTALVAWTAGGALAIAAAGLPFAAREFRSLGAAARTEPARSFVLPGATEAMTVLVAVDLLFAVFVVLQVAYLFGGQERVEATGVRYSDYAREGYFQLVAVVAGAGLLLAVAEAAAHRARGFVPAALALVALTSVILASAAVRMGLYQQIYGWTELRFYVGASIGWLALALAIAAILLLRERMAWLFHGLAFAAIGVTLAVTAIGPQAFVTQMNVARVVDPALVPSGGHTGLDGEYAASLGFDAVPELVAVLPRLDSRSRAALIGVLEIRRHELAADPTFGGWGAWNLARERARAALANLPER